MAKLHEVASRIARGLPKVAPWSLDRVVEHYSGARRRRYEDAARVYRDHGFNDKDLVVKAFVKCEKIRFSEHKRNPDPRMIQFRGPVFSVVYAQYIKAIEEVVYRLKGNRINGLRVTSVFGKGLSSTAKGRLLKKKWDKFKRPVGMSWDASRFDQHFDVEHLKLLHRIYMTVCYCTFFAYLLKQTIRNKVVSTRGVRYTALGGRMSGEMDTALGACLLMLTSAIACLEELDVTNYELLDDGDDIVVIMEEEDYQRVKDLVGPTFKTYGQDLKVENVARTMEGVKWCQAAPVCVDGEYKFIRDPAKVISGGLAGPKWLQMHSPAARRALANTIGLGEGHMNKGVPILQEYAMALIRNAATSRQVKLAHNDSLMYKVRHEIGKSSLSQLPRLDPTPISDDTRLSFSLAFGITVDEQLSYEEYLRNWVFEFDDYQQQPEPVDVPNWEWNCFSDELSTH